MAGDEADKAYALQLQAQYDEEEAYRLSLSNWDGGSGGASTSDDQTAAREKLSSRKHISVVDSSWELIDPIPNIHSLFLEFNDAFFYGKLNGIEVRWSPRMTLCAGLCCYEGRGGLCSVRLSEPLLKLRPRKDLVETLLHEMIHAYLFVTHNNRDHDAHGPEFLKHMHRINKETGAKISVYHNFHDEVDTYRTHWWRCDGPCQHRKPFYGIVRRAMNRAPSSRDPWWSEHQKTCGGTFAKIREPENYKKRKAKDSDSGPKKQARVDSKDIRELFSSRKDQKSERSKPFPGKQSNVHTISKSIPKDDPDEDAMPFPEKQSNVHSVSKSPPTAESTTVVPFSGKGHVLGRGSNGVGKRTESALSRLLGSPMNNAKHSNIPPVEVPRTTSSSSSSGRNFSISSPTLSQLIDKPITNSYTSQGKVSDSFPFGSSSSNNGGNVNGTLFRNGGSKPNSLLDSLLSTETKTVSKTSVNARRDGSLKQPTLAELLNNTSTSSISDNAPKAPTSRSSKKMKLLRDLLSSDSDEDEASKLNGSLHPTEEPPPAVNTLNSSGSPPLINLEGAGEDASLMVSCPVCGQEVYESVINDHLDSVCLMGAA